MNRRLSNILYDAKYQNARDFYSDFYEAEREFEDYKHAEKVWEKKYGKENGTSVKESLK